jgi:RNA polymerase sigma factor (sigma-70 family)
MTWVEVLIMLSTAIPLQDLNDDDLLRETLSGQREAYGLLIRKYKDSLYDMARRILSDAEEAEDVIQESFTEAYRHLEKFNHESRFSTWVYSIVLNRVRNRLRRNKTIRWSSLDAGATRDQDSPPIEYSDQKPSILSIVENKLSLEAVQRAVQTLPLEYRSIFILHYMQDLPLQEVAMRLGRPVSTVKVYLHRARKRLYQYFSAKDQAIL